MSGQAGGSLFREGRRGSAHRYGARVQRARRPIPACPRLYSPQGPQVCLHFSPLVTPETALIWLLLRRAQSRPRFSHCPCSQFRRPVPQDSGPPAGLLPVTAAPQRGSFPLGTPRYFDTGPDRADACVWHVIDLPKPSPSEGEGDDDRTAVPTPSSPGDAAAGRVAESGRASTASSPYLEAQGNGEGTALCWIAVEVRPRSFRHPGLPDRVPGDAVRMGEEPHGSAPPVRTGPDSHRGASAPPTPRSPFIRFPLNQYIPRSTTSLSGGLCP